MTEKTIHPLKESDLLLAEYAVSHFVARPDAGLTPEDLLRSDYWGHNARKLRPDTLIEAICRDGSWEARYRVLEVGQNWARVAMLSKHYYDVGMIAPHGDATYGVDFNDLEKHVVFRIVNNRRDNLASGIRDRKKAEDMRDKFAEVHGGKVIAE